MCLAGQLITKARAHQSRAADPRVIGWYRSTAPGHLFQGNGNAIFSPDGDHHIEGALSDQLNASGPQPRSQQAICRRRPSAALEMSQRCDPGVKPRELL